MTGENDKYLEIAKQIVAKVDEMTADDTPNETRIAKQKEAHALIKQFRYKENMESAYDHLKMHGPRANYQPSSFVALDLHAYIETLHEAVEVAPARHIKRAEEFKEAKAAPATLVDDMVALREELKTASLDRAKEIETALFQKLEDLTSHYKAHQVAVMLLLTEKKQLSDVQDFVDLKPILGKEVVERKAALKAEEKALRGYKKSIQEIVDKTTSLSDVSTFPQLENDSQAITFLIHKLKIPPEYQKSLCAFVDLKIGVAAGDSVEIKLTAYLEEKVAAQRNRLIRFEIKQAVKDLLDAIEHFHPTSNLTNTAIHQQADVLKVQIATLSALHTKFDTIWLEEVNQLLSERALQYDFIARGSACDYVSTLIDNKLQDVFQQKAKEHIQLILQKAHTAMLAMETDSFVQFKQQAMDEVFRINHDVESPVINKDYAIISAVTEYNVGCAGVSATLTTIDAVPVDVDILRDEISQRLTQLFQVKEQELRDAKTAAETLSQQFLDIYKALFADDIDDEKLADLTATLQHSLAQLDALTDSLEVRALFKERINAGIRNAPISETTQSIIQINTPAGLHHDVDTLNAHLVARANQKLLDRQTQKAKEHLDTIFREARMALDSNEPADFESAVREVFAQIALISHAKASPVLNKDEVVSAARDYYNLEKHKTSDQLNDVAVPTQTANQLKDELQQQFIILFSAKRQELKDSATQAEQLSAQFLTQYKALFADDITDDGIDALETGLAALKNDITKLSDSDVIRTLFRTRINDGIRLDPISEGTEIINPCANLQALSLESERLTQHLVARAREKLLLRQKERAKDHVLQIGRNIGQVELQEDTVALEALKQQTEQLLAEILDDDKVYPKESVVTFAREEFNTKNFCDESLTASVKTREILQQELQAILDKLYQKQLEEIDKKNKQKAPPKAVVADDVEKREAERRFHFALFGDYAHDLPIKVNDSYGLIDAQHLSEYGTDALFSDNQSKFFEVRCDRREVTPEIERQLKDKGVTMQSNAGRHYVARLTSNYLTLTMPGSQFTRCDKDTPEQSYERTLLSMVEMVNQLVANCQSIYLSGSNYIKAVGRLYIAALEGASGGQIMFKTLYPPLEYVEMSDEYHKAKAFVDKLMASDYGKTITAKEFYLSALDPTRGIDVPRGKDAPKAASPNASI